jgi:hypothetical protein
MPYTPKDATEATATVNHEAAASNYDTDDREDFADSDRGLSHRVGMWLS